jgi:hypothetical protein
LTFSAKLPRAFGAPAPLRYGALGLFEARATLGEAARALFGQPNNLFFDLAGAEVTFSFGANFLETWVSPVAYTRGFAKMRQGTPGKRGYLVHFEPRLSQTAVKADEWFAIKPGSEGLLALALGKLAAEHQGKVIAAYEGVDVLLPLKPPDSKWKPSSAWRASMATHATPWPSPAARRWPRATAWMPPKPSCR